MEITEYAKDILLELINTGIGRAAVALSEMLNQEIMLTVPEIKILPAKELKEDLSKLYKEKFVVVSQIFSGKLEGQGIVAFSNLEAKILVKLLLEEPVDSEEDFNVMELEVLAEVGNLIISAVSGTICNMAEIESTCGLPQVKSSDSIAEIFQKKDKGNFYLMGHTTFLAKKSQITGNFLFIYTYEHIDIIIEKFL